MTAAIHTMPNEARALPTNAEAEQALLGAILCDNRCFDAVGDFLRPEHFQHAVHGEIFAACAKAIEGGRKVDAVSLKHHFDGHEDLAEVGGAGYLAELVAAVPSIINAKDYGEAIHDCALRREQIMVYREQIARSLDMDQDVTGQDILEETEAKLQGIAEVGAVGGPGHLSEAAGESLVDIEQTWKQEGDVAGVTTGLVDLDRLTSGLLAPDLVILAGRPSMGKTALALHVATAAARNHGPVLFFSLEMSSKDIAARYLSDQGGVAARRLRQPRAISQEEFQHLARKAEESRQVPLYLDDTPQLTVSQMMARARRSKRRHGLSLIVCDHLDYVTPPNPKDQSKVDRIGATMKAFKAMAKHLGVPVLLLHQLSRAVELRDNKRPMLSDLRDSGHIEQDADAVWFVFREAYYLESQDDIEALARLEEVKNLAEVIVAKQRMGPRGRAVQLHFNGELMRFSNLHKGDLFDG